MDENANTDNADRSPFRRFPYVQLAFCLACLTVTAWTWMTYSHAWRATSADFEACEALGLLDSWCDRYVRLDEPVEVHPLLVLEMRTVLTMFGNGRFSAYAVVKLPYDPLQRAPLKPALARVVGDDSPPAPAPEPNDTLPHLYGRVGMGDFGPGRITIDGRVSRFHPASIAGIVVGAMGVFIFGLYLRRWAKERRAGA